MSMLGNLQLTVKIDRVPADVKTIENGWKQFEMALGEQTVTLTFRPQVFKQLEQAQENYALWVAVIVGQISNNDQGFLLRDCSVTVYPLQTFLTSALPNAELQTVGPTILEGVQEKKAEEIASPPAPPPPSSLAVSSSQQKATSYEVLLRSKAPDAKGLVFMRKLIKGTGEFKAHYFSNHRHLFEQLSQGQKPQVLFITCSDSRIDPNLITQTQMGELFVIRNPGNIIPPFGAANGGEGAAVEYAIHNLGIEQVVICGHSHCGAMKGLLQLGNLQQEMPLVYDWLKHAEATQRVVKENYSNYNSEELLKSAIGENVLTQIENLKTYPVVRAKLNQGKLHIYGWIYRIETGEVLAYDPVSHAYVPPSCDLIDHHPQEQPTPSQLTSMSALSIADELPQQRQASANGKVKTVSQDPLEVFLYNWRKALRNNE